MKYRDEGQERMDRDIDRALTLLGRVGPPLAILGVLIIALMVWKLL